MTAEEIVMQALETYKMGRKPVFMAGGPSLEDIQRIYEETQSIRRTAAKLGIAIGTAKKYIVLLEASRASGRNPDPATWLTRHPTGMVLWAKEYGQTLPRSATEISKLSGYSMDQVYCFLRKRVKAAEAYIRHLGDIREMKGISLVDTKGRVIPSGMLNQVEYEIDKYNLVVSIRGVLNFGGVVTFKMGFIPFVKLLQGSESTPRE